MDDIRRIVKLNNGATDYKKLKGFLDAELRFAGNLIECGWDEIETKRGCFRPRLKGLSLRFLAATSHVTRREHSLSIAMMEC
jgi:hypothetical protein